MSGHNEHNEHKRRQIVLDTETTGLVIEDGNRILQIAGVEIINRQLTGNDYCQLIDPERESEAEAAKVHRITSQDVQGKPKFAEEWPRFLEYVRDSEVVLHNADFDVGFLDAELQRMGLGPFAEEAQCVITDTLKLARKRYPGATNTLDALCDRYSISTVARDESHRADVDAKLLASVYLALTSGQEALGLAATAQKRVSEGEWGGRPLPVLRADEAEIEAHEAFLDNMEKSSDKPSVWRQSPK